MPYPSHEYLVRRVNELESIIGLYNKEITKTEVVLLREEKEGRRLTNHELTILSRKLGVLHCFLNKAMEKLDETRRRLHT